MRFDSIIIGGGLSGLLSGIALARGGSKVAIISSGKSALHFFSGSLELWREGAESLEQFARENSSHPYSKIIEAGSIEGYTAIVKDIFSRAGIALKGDGSQNHLRLTPLGALKPAWLTMDEYLTFDTEGECGYRKVALVGIEGYMDFYPEFIAGELAKRGLECRLYNVSLAAFDSLRESATEMRAVQISRSLRGEVVAEYASKIAQVVGDEELVLLPAVFGLGDKEALGTIENATGKRVLVAPTVSVSASGVRVQKALMEEFQRLGGKVLSNDSVTGCTIEEGKVRSIRTANLEGEELVAENYILATGSLFGRGLVATAEGVYEPIAGLDVVAPTLRQEWYSQDLLDAQPFERFGVATDNLLHPLLGGKPVENLYAIGALLAGADAVKEGCGGGIAVMSALRVVKEIEKRG